MRSEPKLQNRKSNMTAPSATAPRRWAAPSRPTTVASTSPSKGVVTCERVIGKASASMRRWLTSTAREGGAGASMTFRIGSAAVEKTRDQPDRDDDHGAVEGPARHIAHGLEAQ